MTSANNNSDLRSSLHQILTDFGPSVRPSLVAAQQQKESFRKRKQLLVGATAFSKPDGEANADDNTNTQESLQSLVAALSFSPKEEEEDKENAAPSTNKSKKSQKFTFETPQKTTPPSWVLQRTSSNNQPKTPLTVSTLGEEETIVEDCDDKSTTQSTTEAPRVTPTTIADDASVLSPPAVAGRRHSNNSMDAVALAYPLSLPIEDAPSTSPSTAATSSKSVRKYPTVDTNIPGAGTRRSSVNQVKTLSSGSSSRRSSFSRIAPRRSTALRRHTPFVAQHVYQDFKNLWAWSKDHVPVAPLVMNLAEQVVCGVAPHDTLVDLDQQVATPFVAALDEHVVGPVVHSVCQAWQGLIGNNNNGEEDA